jgi:hypothetical protein
MIEQRGRQGGAKLSRESDERDTRR